MDEVRPEVSGFLLDPGTFEGHTKDVHPVVRWWEIELGDGCLGSWWVTNRSPWGFPNLVRLPSVSVYCHSFPSPYSPKTSASGILTSNIVRVYIQAHRFWCPSRGVDRTEGHRHVIAHAHSVKVNLMIKSRVFT